MREHSFVKGTSASNGGVLLGNERTSKREEQNNIAYIRKLELSTSDAV